MASSQGSRCASSPFIADTPAEPVQVEDAATLAEIRNNAILDEYALHYGEERALFRGEVEEQAGNE
jgi:hypothetical protein